MIVLDKPLTSLRAVNDRIGGVKYPRADNKQKFMQGLRYLGTMGGKFYYADQNDKAAVLPVRPSVPAQPVAPAPSIAIGGRLAGRKL